MASKEEPDKSLATGGMNRSDPTGGSAKGIPMFSFRFSSCRWMQLPTSEKVDAYSIESLC